MRDAELTTVPLVCCSFIVGQPGAKRAVAIALRNRWRRHRIGDALKDEVMPKNILMIGPTGVGKTEVARRLAKLVDAPFIKVCSVGDRELRSEARTFGQMLDDYWQMVVWVSLGKYCWQR